MLKVYRVFVHRCPNCDNCACSHGRRATTIPHKQISQPHRFTLNDSVFIL